MSTAIFENVIKYIDKNKVVSFDIFDTLLLRPFSVPKNVFAYMEEQFNMPNFCRERQKAEKKARAATNTEEVDLDLIYGNLEDFDKAKELSVEENILFGNAEIKKLYQYAIENAKGVVLISDMYLPKNFIKKVLKREGFEGYGKLYLSSEINKTKVTGTLFDFVLGELQISPDDLIHIGDDLHSDLYIPKKKGIRAFKYEKPIEAFYNMRPYRRKSVTWYEDLFIQMTATNPRRMEFSYWENFGYEIGGPIVLSYLKWVISCIEEQKKEITDVAFIARDGYLLKYAYDKYFKDAYPEIKSHYIYAPRTLTIIYELQKNKNISQFPIHYLESIYKHYYDVLPEASKNFTKENAREWIEKNADFLRSFMTSECQEYDNYVKNENFGNKDVVLVDSITQGFSAQRLLERGLGRSVLGAYWIILQADNNFAYKTFQPGTIELVFSWLLIEFILSSPSPSVDSVKNSVPIYNNAPYEAKRLEIFTKIETGVKCFLDDICNSEFKQIKVPEEVIRMYFNLFCQNGTKRDINEFAALKYSRNLDHSDEIDLEPFAVKKTGLRKYMFTKIKRQIIMRPKLYCLYKDLYNFKNKLFKK